jgi:predicted metal-binding protein
MEKIGNIICGRYQNCGGGKCFRALRERVGAFSLYPTDETVEIVGYSYCGGCPGGNIKHVPAEMKKTGTIAGLMRPERVQLNTIDRSPSEDFARMVSMDRMEQFKQFFSGEVEVISEKEQDESRSLFSKAVTDADILALLRRRPCTVHGNVGRTRPAFH